MATIPWLADVLRAAGVPVVEVGGWQTRMRSGSFEPFGVLWHHTAATSSASNPAPALNVCVNGRSDLAGPLCHALVDYNGVFHVISAGRANHAGESGGSGPIPAGDGNAMLIGWEIDYNGVSQAMTAAQYNNSVKATAAVLKRLGRDASYARGHRETSVTGKIDPSFIDLNAMRSDVANAMRGRGTTTVGWYRNSDSSFHLRNGLSGGDSHYAFVLGPANSGDIVPVTGDWDGTGTTTAGWYRPSDSSWHLRNSLSGGESNYAFVFGPPNSGGVFPVTGDWNGDGRTTVGWYRASDSSWHLRNSLSGGSSDLAFVFGPPNSGGIVPVTGDWNGDGRTTVGWYR
ncbi:MAG TPA: N-acetylmuramoyl-L-alanine amidase, partial [Candidatus Limnocylindrales bacterium]